MRLNAALVSAELAASRRSADTAITDRRVRVNGSLTTDFSYPVQPGDVLRLDDREARIRDSVQTMAIAFYKPAGYVVSHRAQSGQRSMYELLPERYRNFKPGGRLDIDSEGLMVLSNDGNFINRLIHPASGLTKTYLVTVSQQLNRQHVERLREPMNIGGCNIVAISVRQLDRHRITITISQGLNRQVRKMCGQAGLSVTKLVRTKLGRISLGDLQPGKWRQIRLK